MDQKIDELPKKGFLPPDVEQNHFTFFPHVNILSYVVLKIAKRIVRER